MSDKQVLGLTLREIGQMIKLHSGGKHEDIKLLSYYITIGNKVAQGSDLSFDRFAAMLIDRAPEKEEISDDDVLSHLEGRMNG